MRKPDDTIQESREYSTGYDDFISLILPILRDFLPILLDRWSEFTDRPTLKILEQENRYLRSRINRLEKRVQWLVMFQVVLAMFFLFLVILIALKAI
ncbi:MAG: hypothetical protein H3C43_05610 [Leptonema sp. (in: Bacteria)]|nr:hypothetical protein [Leptonema sp. (in: bacteria)]